MAGTDKRPVSPVNGQPLPRGKPFKTSEEAREAGKKGGKKSGQKRKARKTLREDLLAVLSTLEIPQKDGTKKVPVQEALSTSLIKAALNGNVRAYEIIRDTIGEKPVENVSIVASDFAALDDAFKGLDGEKD